jgi:hypothetical protein
VELILAYTDPGAGATLIQLLLAGSVGIGALLKLRWHQIKGFFRRSEAQQADPDEVEAAIE